MDGGSNHRFCAMYIDFTRIKSGEDFELLCEDLLQAMCFRIEAKVARRPDLGKDMIATLTQTDPAGFEETHRYLVECKHFAKSDVSVREEDIGSPIARMGAHACDRYLLITSTVPSEKVRHQLDGIRNTVKSYMARSWSKGDLRQLLAKHPQVRDRHIPLAETAQTAKNIRGLLSAGADLTQVKRLLKEDPHVLPIEYFVQSQYEFKTDVDVGGVGMVDCVAARSDTEGMRLYMYFFGTPYESPFTASGKPKSELEELLCRSSHLTCLAAHPVSGDHPLHYEAITGHETGGMHPSWIESREELNLGPYTQISVFLVVGQRSNRRTNHEINVEREKERWLESYRRYPHGRGINLREPIIWIMSYDRLLSDGQAMSVSIR